MGPDSAKPLARYRISDLVVDVGTRRVRRAGQTLKLGGLTFDLLQTLAESAPNIVSYDELAEKVWNGRPVTPETIAQRAKMLRDALSDDARSPHYFEPVRGQGYRMCHAAEPVAPVASARFRRTGTIASLLGLAVLAAAVLAAAFRLDIGFSPSERPPMPIDNQSSASERTPIPIVVVPMENLAGDDEQQVLADEATIELNYRLNQIDGLWVAPLASSLAFRDLGLTIREFGEHLGVDYVVVINVWASGTRASVEVYAVPDESLIWSRKFPGETSLSLKLLEDMALAVAEALEIELGVGELGNRPGMTRDHVAYELRMQALGLRNSPFFSEMEQILGAAVALLDSAIALDPDFALAWLDKAQFYTQASQAAEEIPPETRAEWAASAALAIDEARALAPDSVEIVAFAAQQALQRGEWLESQSLLSGLINSQAVGAYDSDVSLVYGQFLKSTGFTSAAIGVLHPASTLDRYNGLLALQLGDAYLAAGEFQKALNEYDRGLGLPNPPTDMLNGSSLLAALGTGNKELIGDRLGRIAAERDPGLAASMIALIDEPQLALDELAKHVRETKNPSGLSIGIAASWAAYFGADDYALELLNSIPPPARNWVLANVIWRPAMAEVRKSPAFVELLAAMGLTEFWREFGPPEMCEPTEDDSYSCR